MVAIYMPYVIPTGNHILISLRSCSNIGVLKIANIAKRRHVSALCVCTTDVHFYIQQASNSTP